MLRRFGRLGLGMSRRVSVRMLGFGANDGLLARRAVGIMADQDYLGLGALVRKAFLLHV